MRKILIIVLLFFSCQRPVVVEFEEVLELGLGFEEVIEVRSDWEIFIEALIQIESGGDSMAVGSKDDVGVLQIRPIFVMEVNRILGEDRYTLDDRYSRERSIEMFEIMNPEKDMHLALKRHNPRAGKQYEQKIMREFNRLKN